MTRGGADTVPRTALYAATVFVAALAAAGAPARADDITLPFQVPDRASALRLVIDFERSAKAGDWTTAADKLQQLLDTPATYPVVIRAKGISPARFEGAGAPSNLTVYAINGSTGQPFWVQPLYGIFAVYGLWPMQSPGGGRDLLLSLSFEVDNNTVQPAMVCLDGRGGGIRWTDAGVYNPGSADAVSDVNGIWVASLFKSAGGSNGTFYVAGLSPTDGTISWKVEVGMMADRLAVDGAGIVYATDWGFVYSINPLYGNVVWKAPVPPDARYPGVLLASGDRKEVFLTYGDDGGAARYLGFSTLDGSLASSSNGSFGPGGFYGAADANGDGVEDLLMLDWTGGEYRAVDSHDGTLASVKNISRWSGAGRAFDVGDVDGDNVADWICASVGSLAGFSGARWGGLWSAGCNASWTPLRADRESPDSLVLVFRTPTGLAMCGLDIGGGQREWGLALVVVPLAFCIAALALAVLRGKRRRGATPPNEKP